MKNDPTLTEYAGEVLGGTPEQVAVKGIAAIVTASLASLEGWANATAPVLLAYLVLVLIDVIMGVMLAHRNNDPFQPSKLVVGPAKKLGLTAALFLGAAVIDTVVPGTFILTGVAGYICVAQFIDTADKYHTLTGSKVVEWIKERLGINVSAKPNEQNGG